MSLELQLEAHKAVFEKLMFAVGEDFIKLAQAAVTCLKNGHKIILMGNGGSAADSQHIAAEFVGQFKQKRKALPAIALTTDTSILTALANDFGYECVFARQLEALAKPGDLVIAITTSGDSKNITTALLMAKNKRLPTALLTGRDGGLAKLYSGINLIVPSDETSRIQEAHIFLGHCLIEQVEKELRSEF